VGGGDEQKEEHENEKVASLTAVRGDIDMYISATFRRGKILFRRICKNMVFATKYTEAPTFSGSL
jgi:hypothetical protein